MQKKAEKSTMKRFVKKKSDDTIFFNEIFQQSLCTPIFTLFQYNYCFENGFSYGMWF